MNGFNNIGQTASAAFELFPNSAVLEYVQAVQETGLGEQDARLLLETLAAFLEVADNNPTGELSFAGSLRAAVFNGAEKVTGEARLDRLLMLDLNYPKLKAIPRLRDVYENKLSRNGESGR